MILFFFSFFSGAWALDPSTAHSKLSLISEYEDISATESSLIGVRVELEKDWHTYWSYPGDSGSPPVLKVKAATGTEVGGILWPVPHRIALGPVTTLGLEGDALFAFPVLAPPDSKPGDRFKIGVEGEVLVCKSICIPAPVRLEKEFTVSPHLKNKSEDFFRFVSLQKSRPEIEKDAHWEIKRNGEVIKIILRLPKRFSDAKIADFFPYSEIGVSAAAPVIRKTDVGTWEWTTQDSGFPVKESRGLGVIRLEKKGETKFLALGETLVQGTEKFVDPSEWNLKEFLRAAFFAFLGGLLLNLMPCVFPILSMKVFGILKQNIESEHESRVENLFYSIGVILSFLVIALVLVLLRSAGEAVGWGFQLQSPFVLGGLFFLFLGIGLHFIGLFEFNFSGTGFGQSWVKDGKSGAFMAGALSVVVASPCTAPFMGASLGYAIAQPLPILFLIFFFLGVGLSFPTLILAAEPRLLRFLPRPGIWMLKMKKLLSIPMFLTAVWIGWVFLRVVHPAQEERSGSGILWNKFSTIELQKSLSEGKWVFIDFTADWCITCKVNERLVFTDPEVKSFIAQSGLVMMRGDWTKRDPAITKVLEEHSRIGVPFYLLRGPKDGGKGIVFPEALTAGIWIRKMHESTGL